MNNTAERQKWLRIYQNVWDLVRITFFDKSRLTDWDRLAHAYDAEIVDEASALACVDKLLASLGDTYTERVVPPPVNLITPSESAPADPYPQEKPRDVLAVLTSDNLGFLRIATFDRADIADIVEEAAKKLAGCRGIVLDLRGNGGGRMHESMECCSLLLDNAIISTIKFREGDGIATWRYCINSDQFFTEVTVSDEAGTVLSTHNEMYKRRAPVLAGKPLVILINRRTASAGELSVCPLVQYGEAGKVLMVGSGPTPAKGIGQGEYAIPDSDVRIRVTRVHWFAPGGEWLGDCGQTTANGIEPDVRVEGDHGPQGAQAALDELRKMLAQLQEAAEPAA